MRKFLSVMSIQGRAVAVAVAVAYSCLSCKQDTEGRGQWKVDQDGLVVKCAV